VKVSRLTVDFTDGRKYISAGALHVWGPIWVKLGMVYSSRHKSNPITALDRP